ncbi:DUF1385 domain-containing protein [Anaeroarcus burkinensis]|uniref:DUF1385 domain-containing protein n=1 Tax=Anaeroarcus burkinensis TaxID=82376 RepID=UPI0004099115|nr:DUF1385 domain-containing protein [Anaeroarcus burkinensis]
MSKKPTIGGQAVIEGVMMRGPEYLATAVRRPDGGIELKKEPFSSINKRYPVLKLPFVRGTVALVESLVYGLQALSFSAQAAGEEEEQLSTKELVLTMLVSFVLAIGLFVVLPTFAAKYIHEAVTDPVWLNLLEGALRLILFFGYVAAISSMKDIQRVFQYHGAEHKTIYAYEAGEELTVENVRKHSTLHPRCGTNFLLIVMVVSILLFAFLGWPDLWLRITSRIVLLPVVAGIAYEIIRYAGRHVGEQALVSAIVLPGMWLQKLTTRQPDDSQIEVAIAALQAVLPEQEPTVKEKENEPAAG